MTDPTHADHRPLIEKPEKSNSGGSKEYYLFFFPDMGLDSCDSNVKHRDDPDIKRFVGLVSDGFLIWSKLQRNDSLQLTILVRRRAEKT